MNMEKVACLVKLAKQTKEQRNAKARQRYRQGGQQLRRKAKMQQRMRRRQGGQTLQNRVKMQQQRLKYKPVRIRKEPLQKRQRDMS